MEITVQSALNQLKLIDKKIEKALETNFAGVALGNKAVQGYKTNDDFSERAKSNLQSLRDLIARRKEIKDAIVASNAATPVKVAGKEMTVASAIERKDSIVHDRKLLAKLVRDKNAADSLIERENNKLEQEISVKAEAMLGKDSIKADPSQIEEVRKILMAQKEPKLIDPINIQSLIDTLSNDIEEFEANVDSALSEINAITRITISGPETNPQ